MARVLMLVNNDWKIDSRVIREATALASEGHEVHVISRAAVTEQVTQTQAGVTFYSVPHTSAYARTWQAAAQQLRSHYGVILQSRSGYAYVVLATHVGTVILSCVAALAAMVILSPVLMALAVIGVGGAIAVPVARRLYRVNALRRALGRARPLAKLAWWAVGIARVVKSHAIAPLQGVNLREKARTVFHYVVNEHVRYLNQFGVETKALSLKLRPDVIHSHDLVTLSTGRAIARKLRRPLVYDAHELETHTNYWSLAPATHKWIAIYESALIRRTQAVVTVCESIADWLRDHYRIARPVVVHNSPDLASIEIQPDTPNIRASLHLDRDTPLAVYVGAVTIDRGMVHCARAAALVPGLHFAFVGPRHGPTEAEILETARVLGAENRIHLVDPVPSNEVSAFVSTADCSVIAIQNVCLSYYFCFPNKLLESAISGVPVAVGRLVELERFVNRFKVGVTMDERDPAAIAQAIRTILENPALYRPTLETREAIRSEYGWPAQRARLLELYRRL